MPCCVPPVGSDHAGQAAAGGESPTLEHARSSCHPAAHRAPGAGRLRVARHVGRQAAVRSLGDRPRAPLELRNVPSDAVDGCRHCDAGTVCKLYSCAESRIPRDDEQLSKAVLEALPVLAARLRVSSSDLNRSIAAEMAEVLDQASAWLHQEALAPAVRKAQKALATAVAAAGVSFVGVVALGATASSTETPGTTGPAVPMAVLVTLSLEDARKVSEANDHIALGDLQCHPDTEKGGTVVPGTLLQGTLEDPQVVVAGTKTVEGSPPCPGARLTPPVGGTSLEPLSTRPRRLPRHRAFRPRHVPSVAALTPDGGAGRAPHA